MNTTETKEVNVYLSKLPSGYGHYKLSFDLDGNKLSAVTNNMDLIDRIKRGSTEFDSFEEIEDSQAATKQAIEFVLDQNNINYSCVDTFQSMQYGLIYSVIYYPEENTDNSIN